MLSIPVIFAVIAGVVLACALLAHWLHHLFEGERFLRDWLRERRLDRFDLADLDAVWQGTDRVDGAGRADLVVSLTTIPSRIDQIDLALKSLLDQSQPPRRIVLNVPEFSQREQCPYQVPDRLLGLKALEVRRCDDLGPATKAIPTLLSESADQAVLVVDDDRIYPYDFVQTAAKAAAQEGEAALTMSGWVVPKDLTDRPTTIWSNLAMLPPAPVRGTRLRYPREVDIMQGVMGYLVRPRFFDLKELADVKSAPRAAQLADDVRTSALCRVPKLVTPVRGLSFLPKRLYAHFKDTALANLNRGDGSPETRNNTIAIRHYADKWRVGGGTR